jgi:hypothetical protein
MTVDAERVDAKSRVCHIDREARITNELMERLSPAIRGGLNGRSAREARTELWAAMEADIIGNLIDRLKVSEEALLGLLRGTHVIVRRGCRR